MSKIVARVESKELSSVRSYNDLLVWQKSMDMVVAVYKEIASFPKEEIYGLSSQIKRSCVSIPSNIAEGSSKRSTAEFMRYINIADGSLAELETQIITAERLGFLQQERSNNLLMKMNEIGKMLQGLYTALENRMAQKTKLSTLSSNH